MSSDAFWYYFFAARTAAASRATSEDSGAGAARPSTFRARERRQVSSHSGVRREGAVFDVRGKLYLHSFSFFLCCPLVNAIVKYKARSVI